MQLKSKHLKCHKHILNNLAELFNVKMGVKLMNIQEMILTLQTYWSDHNCNLMQAYDVEKGAGTMSPMTLLRSLGPEPWNVAYVEPSRRPDRSEERRVGKECGDRGAREQHGINE